jgi:hypothetical protein
MALMNPSALAPEEQRAADLDEAFNGTTAKIEGFKPVRRVTAQVFDILLRANNVFASGPKGLKAIGIEPKELQKVLSPKIDGEPNPEFDPTRAAAFAPKVAEVVALLTCSDSEVDECEDDISKLKGLRRRITRNKDTIELMELMGDVQAEFTKINRSTAVVEEETTAGESAEDAKKKQGPASEPES